MSIQRKTREKIIQTCFFFRYLKHFHFSVKSYNFQFYDSLNFDFRWFLHLKINVCNLLFSGPLRKRDIITQSTHVNEKVIKKKSRCKQKKKQKEHLENKNSKVNVNKKTIEKKVYHEIRDHVRKEVLIRGEKTDHLENKNSKVNISKKTIKKKFIMKKRSYKIMDLCKKK